MPVQPKPRKPGRPTLPKGSAKAETLRIRVTPSELRTFEKIAKASKQTVSEWIRTRLTSDDWNKMLTLLANARDEYAEMGEESSAKTCDLTIGLLQRIEMRDLG